MNNPTSSCELTPREAGFSIPAEWEHHRATWVSWPHNLDTWPYNLAAAQQEFVELIRTIAAGELVCVVASGHALADARSKLSAIKNVEFFEFPTNDAWIRDYGPALLINPESARLGAMNWRYNGWGEKYPPFDSDVEVGQKIATALEARYWASELVIEGGAIDVDGQGLVLTTESCLLNDNRNGNSNRETIESFFEESLGLRAVWLPSLQIEGDDTDGHIDQQARFIDSETVVLAEDKYRSEVDSQSREILNSEGIRTVSLPLPFPMTTHGMRIPASYLNFYFCNAGVIVPQFGDQNADDRGVSILRELLPTRDIIGLPSSELSYGLGSFHCLTQQEPSVTCTS